MIPFVPPLAAVLLAVACSAAVPAAERTPDPEPALWAVEFTVGGTMFAPAGEAAAPVREPIDIRARFEFRESAAPGGQDVLRRYRAAAADMAVGDRTERRRLGADARVVLFGLQGTTPTPGLADGFLSRDEAELLDLPFDPLLLPGLAPATEAGPGDSWRLPPDLVAGLLAIDSVTGGGIDVVLADAAEGVARLDLKGTVHGAVDGAITRIAVTGSARCRCLRSGTGERWIVAGPIDRLAATLAERREAGWVAPGLEVEATLSLTRSPVPPGTDEDHDLAPPPPGRPRGRSRGGRVWHRHRHGRYTLVLDRRWRVVEDGPEGLVMRLADRGALVAQCSILPLPRSNPKQPPTVEQVCRDVERSLAGQFEHFAAAEETTREDGTRVVRVLAEGSAEGRPFRWIHHLLTDSGGNRTAVTFMLESALADRFGAADRELVGGIVLPPEPEPAAAGAERAGPPLGGAEKRERDGPQP